MLIQLARKTGRSGYIGDGENRWPAVHRLDAARLLVLALEKAPAGARLHAVSNEGVPARDIAGVLDRKLGLPVESVPEEHFGSFGAFFALDAPRRARSRRRGSARQRATVRTLSPSARQARAPAGRGVMAASFDAWVKVVDMASIFHAGVPDHSDECAADRGNVPQLALDVSEGFGFPSLCVGSSSSRR
nr:hypothetical protein [Sorangium aterium]